MIQGSGAVPGEPADSKVPLSVIAREWTRIGCLGFGGPPAHIALLRALCVDRRGWLSADEFEDGVAATGLLPGPASTQLAIYCAWRMAGLAGAMVGGFCFIVPGLIIILALSTLFLSAHPPLWVVGAAAGAGAAVPAVALHAALSLAPASWKRATSARPAAKPPPGEQSGAQSGGPPDEQSGGQPGGWPGARWVVYLAAGAVLGALAGPFLVLGIAACGLTELMVRTGRGRPGPLRKDGPGMLLLLAFAAPAATGGLLSVAWVAFKVGALSYGGGFVIIPLMQHDAVHTYHWMTGAQFLSAVALGQVTPGPVVQTVAVVGFAAAGVGGGLLASAVAFAPSFAMVLAGAPRFGAMRRNDRVQAFLTGAGPAAIGAIAGSTIPLGLDLEHLWQLAVLGLAASWLLVIRRGVIAAVLGAAGLGVVAVLAGAPIR